MDHINSFNEYTPEELQENLSDTQRPFGSTRLVRVSLRGKTDSIRTYDITPDEYDYEQKKEALRKIAMDLGFKQNELGSLFEEQLMSGAELEVAKIVYAIRSRLSDKEALEVVRRIVDVKMFTKEMVFDPADADKES